VLRLRRFGRIFIRPDCRFWLASEDILKHTRRGRPYAAARIDYFRALRTGWPIHFDPCPCSDTGVDGAEESCIDVCLEGSPRAGRRGSSAPRDPEKKQRPGRSWSSGFIWPEIGPGYWSTAVGISRSSTLHGLRSARIGVVLQETLKASSTPRSAPNIALLGSGDADGRGSIAAATLAGAHEFHSGNCPKVTTNKSWGGAKRGSKPLRRSAATGSRSRRALGRGNPPHT